jgi:hypothetical protein
MIPVIYLVLPAFLTTTSVIEHVQDNQILEASKAAAAAGQHDLAKQLMCRAHTVRDSKECKELK